MRKKGAQQGVAQSLQYPLFLPVMALTHLAAGEGITLQPALFAALA
jgi:hypothetical protein